MKKVISVFLITLLVPWFSFADGQAGIYEKVMRDCAPLKSDSALLKFVALEYSKATNWEIYWDSTRETFAAEALSAQAITDLIQNQGMSRGLAEILKSPDYARAVQDCFPNEKFFQDLYTMRLVSSDAQGKITATAASYYLGKGFGKILAPLKSLSPLAHKMVIGAVTTWSLYHSYRLIRELTRDSTPEEKAQAEKFLADHVQSPEAIIAEARGMVTTEIARLQQDLARPDLDAAQRAAKQIKLNKLEASLKQIS
jgi:hypothetical protein